MKKFILLMAVALMLTGCVVYPGYYDGYYDAGYYPYGYGYAGPSVNLYFSDFHGGHGFHHGFHGGWRH